MLVLPIPTSAASASGNDVAIGNPMLAVPSNDGGLGMMPPATVLTSVSLIGRTVNDVANVAALGPTVALPQGTSRAPVLESPAILSPPVVPMQPGLGVSLSPTTAPFPQKLVDSIMLGQYVEMRDLLTDIVSLFD